MSLFILKTLRVTKATFSLKKSQNIKDKKLKYILSILLLLLIFFSCSREPAWNFTSKNFKLIKLSEGVYACIHKFGGTAICNVGIIDNGRETIIFDSFLSPNVAREVLDLIPALGLSPIKYVINSHFHNDHIRGNQVFADDVKIISTRKTRDIIEEWEPKDIAEEKEWAGDYFRRYDSLNKAYSGDTNAREYLQIKMWLPYYETLMYSYREIQTRLPDTFIEDQLNLDGPKRKVQIITKGSGHTDSDIILYLPDDEILFTGDLVFNDCHPYLAHGDTEALKNWLNYLKTLKIKSLIPGHGELGKAEDIDEMKKYLLALEDKVKDMKTRNIPITEVDGIAIPDEYKTWWFDRFYSYNLKFIYQENKE